MTEPLDTRDIQGLVARGYGRLEHATYLLLHVTDPAAARARLLEWAEDVVASAAAAPADAAVNLAVTAEGLRALTGADLPDGFAEPFATGMATEYRSRLLGDVAASSPAGWLWGGPSSDRVHVLVLVFAASAGRLSSRVADLRAAAGAGGLRVVAALETAELTGYEPFGFRDGISQPRLAGLGHGDRLGAVVRDGEFVLGYVNEYSQRTERPLLPAEADPQGVLPRDPDGSGAADLGRNGSYLVVRQLEQDVAGFEAFLDAAATTEGVVDAHRRERLAAKLVGRWRSGGAPLALSPHDDDQAYAAANEFGYQALDPDGLRCPVGAHIRRANPRDSLPPGPGTAASLRVNARHRLLRRGRAYRTRRADGGPDEQGLHFMCLNTNLARQYEFVQHTWVNDPSFNGLVGVEDPLVGPRRDGPSDFVEPATPVRIRHIGLPQFVRVRGGAYFFLPGIRALRYLCSPAAGSGRR